ncbi:hypothetical protein JCM10450v2_001317 [Rhodotorula kratochvilovae]
MESPEPAEPAPPPPEVATFVEAGGKVYKKPTKIACQGCRAIKVKCRLPNGNIPTGEWDKDESKCSRCIRLKLPCEYKSALRRGRKPKDRSILENVPASLNGSAPSSVSAPDVSVAETLVQLDPHEGAPMYNLPPSSGVAADPTAPAYALPSVPTSSVPLPSIASSSSSNAPLPPQWPLPSPSGGPSPHLSYPQTSPFSSLQLPIALQPPAWPPPRTMSNPTQSSPAQSANAQPSPASVTGSIAENAQTMLSLAEAADIKSQSFTATRPSLLHGLSKGKKPAPKMPDPVDMHVLTALEASQLFSLFHSHLNCYIVLFDRHLHTAEYVRSTSTVLFTAILAASAKFFRTDLYPQLLLAAQQLVTRAMGGDGEPNIGLLQSLLILTYWKEPFDTSAWLKVGYAIRLGYQLRLHHKRTTPLPANEHEARVILDQERTWIVLVCNDNSYMLADDDDTGHETHMITHWDIDIDAWLAETRPYDVPDDNEQTISISTIKLSPLFKHVAKAANKAAASALASHLDGLLAESHRKYLDPSSVIYQSFTPACCHKARFHWRVARFELARACLTAAGVSDQMVLADFMARASDLVECFEEAVREGILRYMQDVMTVRMFSAGECLGKVFPQVSKTLQTTLVNFITRIYVACSRAKDGNDESAAAFLARFYKAILHALHPSGVPPTRPPSPRPGDALAGLGGMSAFANVNPFEQLGGMESEIFTDLDSLVADLNRDNTYWDSLNAAQTNSSWAWLDQVLLQPLEGANGAP